MSLKLTIFGCLLVNFIFLYRGYVAGPVKETPKKQIKSIIDVIVNDKDIYNSTREIVKNSKHLEECKKVDFPEKFVKLTDTNLNEFLCLAIYDGFVKLGQYDNCTVGNKTDENTSVLNNQTIFNVAVDTALNSLKKDPWVFCGNLQNLSLPVFNGTKDLILQLEAKFEKQSRCVLMCLNDTTNTVNPLCVVLEIIDQQLRAKVENSESKKKDTQPVPAMSPIAQPNDPKIAVVVKSNHTPANPEIKPNTTKKDETNGSETSGTANQAMNDTTKNSPEKLPTKSNLVTPKDNNSKITNVKVNPADPSINDSAEDTEQSPLDVLNTQQENGEAPSSGKSSTIPGKTVDENQVDQSLEYNDKMTGDNEALSELENADSMDDIPNPNAKQIPQLDENPNDQQEDSLPRLSGLQKEDDSHFFGYFTVIGFIGISACLLYHHKQKILAMIVEGRRSRGGRGRKRPSTANYRKLDSNLEEAVTSQCNANVTHVIY